MPPSNNNKENLSTSKTIFPYKLWRIVNDPKFDAAIQWTDTGLSFVIHEENFINLCLGKKNSLFFTTKPRSFVRQLHLYGFKKIDQNEFMHKCFRRDKFCLLKQIKRTYRATKILTTNTGTAMATTSTTATTNTASTNDDDDDDDDNQQILQLQDETQELLKRQLELQAASSSSSGASLADDSQVSKCESSSHEEALELDAMAQTVEPILVEQVQDDELYIFEGSCLVDISFNTWS